MANGLISNTLARRICLALMLILLLALGGCSARTISNMGSQPGSGESASVKKEVAQTSDTSYAPGSSPAPAETVERKISTAWRFTIEVEDSRKANSEISSKVEQFQGYLAESRFSNREDKIQASLTVKVPASKARDMVVFLEQVGRLVEESKTASDVTDQYYDVDARLKVMIKEEERLLGLMENRAASIQELLAVEKEIARVRSERESLQSRLNRLNNQVDYTSFAISLEENRTVLQAPQGTLGKAAEGIKESLNLLIKCINWLFIFLVTSLPFLLLLALVAYLIRKLTLRRRKAKKEIPGQQGISLPNNLGVEAKEQKNDVSTDDSDSND